MNEQKLDSFSYEALAEWAKAWQCDVGVKAIDQMERLRDSNSEEAMRNPEQAVVYSQRAMGIQIVLDNIQEGVRTFERMKKEREEAADRSPSE